MSEPGARVDSSHPLRAAQVGLKDIDALDPEGVVCTVAGYHDIEGALDVDLLVRVIDQTMSEFECGRARYHVVDGQWRESLGPLSALACDVVDLRHLEDPEAAAVELVRQDRFRPMRPLADEPLVRTSVLRLTDDRTWWMLAFHHLVGDGYSGMMFRQRVGVLYDAALRGQPAPPPLTLGLDALRALPAPPPTDLDFWRGYLEGTARLLTGWDRHTPLTGRNLVTSVLVPGVRARASAMADVGSAQWTLLAIGAVADTIADETGAAEAVLGLVMTGRRNRMEWRTPGQLMTVLPLRLARSTGDPAAAVIAVRRELDRLAPHDRDRPEVLRHELPSAFRTGRIHGPLVNVIPFDLPLELSGCTATTHTLSRGPIEDAAVAITPSGSDDLVVELESNPHVYSPAEHDARHAALVATLSGLLP